MGGGTIIPGRRRACGSVRGGDRAIGGWTKRWKDHLMGAKQARSSLGRTLEAMETEFVFFLEGMIPVIIGGI